MKIPQRVVWSEGMFMNPQHLQQADLYHESLLSARLSAMTPYDWGVVEMDVDEKAMAAGQLQLLRFFGILPDGLPVTFERGQPEEPPGRPEQQHEAAAHRGAEEDREVAAAGVEADRARQVLAADHVVDDQLLRGRADDAGGAVHEQDDHRVVVLLVRPVDLLVHVVLRHRVDVVLELHGKDSRARGRSGSGGAEDESRGEREKKSSQEQQFHL